MTNSKVIVFAFIAVNLLTGHLAAAQTPISQIIEIEQRTNLGRREIIDSTYDFWGEDYWVFDKARSGHYIDDLMTLSDQRPDGRNTMATRWLLEQVRRGRVRELGTNLPRRTLNLQSGDDTNWIILTDLEPDDRIALTVLSQNFPKEKVLAVGANLLNSGRKAQLTRRLLNQLGWSSIPVIQGNGGEAESYPGFASNLAAKTYEKEGKDILSGLQQVDARIDGTSSQNLQKFIIQVLTQAAREQKKINFLVLSPATDLANAVLSAQGYQKRILSAIGRVVMVGGWVEVAQSNGDKELRSTYNWNMDPVSARTVLDNIPNVTVLSSHLIKPVFGGGSINFTNAESVVKTMSASEHKAMKDFRTAGESWDGHLIETIPPLASVVGPYVGNQFTPADVLAAAYLIDPSIFTSFQTNVHVNLEIDQKNDKGVAVQLNAPQVGFASQSVVQGLDKEKFLKLVQASLEKLNTQGCQHLLSSVQVKLPSR